MFTAHGTIKNKMVEVRLLQPCPVLNLGLRKADEVVRVPALEAERLVRWGYATLVDGGTLELGCYQTR